MAYGGETPLPTFVIRISVFFLAAVFLCARARVDFTPSFLDLAVAVFVLYSLLSTAWAVYPWSAYQFGLNALCAGLVYFLVRFLEEEDDGRRMVEWTWFVILLAGTVQAACLLFQRFGGDGDGRLWGTFANPNFLAGYLFFGLVASISLGTGGSRKFPSAAGIPYYSAAVLMGCGIWLTYSRAMVAVAVGVSLFLVAVSRGRERKLCLAGAGAGVALAVAAAASRFTFPLDPYGFSRLNLWRAAWKTAVSHPFGVGFGGYGFYWLRFRDPLEGAVFRYGKTADTAHSQFFGVLSELGFPGAFLATASAAIVLALAWREGRREDRLMSLCLIPIGGIVHAFFDVNFNALGILLPVTVCAALLANRNAAGKPKQILLAPAIKAGIFLLLLPCAVYSAATCLGYARYSAGLDALRKGDTEKAMVRFSSAESLDPPNSAYPDAVSSVHYRRFLKTRRPEDLVEAVSAEQRAVAASREDPLRHSQAGFLLGELAEAAPTEGGRRGLREFSLDSLEESVRKDPFNVVAHMRKAEVLRRAGRGKEARETLERLIAFEPNAVIAYPMLARMEEAENPRKAAERYRQAILLSRELEKKPLEIPHRELLKIDAAEIEARIEALERGHFPFRAKGQ